MCITVKVMPQDQADKMKACSLRLRGHQDKEKKSLHNTLFGLPL